MSLTKVIEVVGESNESWEHAVQQSVRDVSGPMRDVVEVEVLRQTAKVERGKISRYQALVRITFHAGHPAEVWSSDSAETNQDF